MKWPAGFVTALVFALIAIPSKGDRGWEFYGGDAGGTRYSPLAQVNRTNVRKLKVAWRYRTGDLRDAATVSQLAFETTPLVIGRTMVLSTPYNRVIALDAATGTELWKFDPKIDRTIRYNQKLVNRGVAFWRSSRAGDAACRERIFEATNDARLFAVDLTTGSLCRDFGDGGFVDLMHGIEGARPGEYQVTSAPAILDDLVIVGSSIADNIRARQATGTVRAFDARTGSLRWSWEPIVRDPEGRRIGAANAWATFAVDSARDLVFIPTGSASPDFYGGDRPGDNRYANSIVALRGRTGEVAWAYQTVHHDVWDYDNPAQPTLLQIRSGDRTVDAVAQPTKAGFLFILDRDTGAPVFPVSEVPAPASSVPGEVLSPTQPIPSFPPAFVPQSVSQKDAWGFFPYDRAVCRRRLGEVINQGLFTPPSRDEALLFPGTIGGFAWGGVAWDPERRIVVGNTNRLPATIRLIDRELFDNCSTADSSELAACAKRSGCSAEMCRLLAPDWRVELSPQEGSPYAVRRSFFLSPLLLPCSPPPFGALTAFDLDQKKLLWESRLGTTRDLAPVPVWFTFGTANLGGPIVTGGGLVFIGAAMDNYLRAFDIEKGRELWRGRLPAGGQATPMTYEVAGRQYVVIAAGGHERLGTKQGDWIIAFTLR